MMINTMNKTLSIMAIGITQITGCGSMEDDLLDLIDASDEKQICFSERNLGVRMWRIDGSYYLAEQKPDRFLGDENQVMALHSLIEHGYVSPDPRPFTERTSIMTSAQKQAYPLTEKGNEYFHWNEPVCIGERTPSEITEYTEPAQQNGMTVTQATFSYDVELNDMTDELGIEEAIKNSQAGWDNEGSAYFIKTNKGWRLEGLSW